jgi:hypothetical protein
LQLHGSQPFKRWQLAAHHDKGVHVLSTVEIIDESEEAEMADNDYEKLKNKVFEQKKRVAGKAGPELSSEEERKVQFSTEPKKSVTDEVKQRSDRDQNTNQSRNHNEAKERMEQGPIQQAEPEAQDLI